MTSRDPRERCIDCNHDRSSHSEKPRACYACRGGKSLHAYRGPEQREAVPA